MYEKIVLLLLFLHVNTVCSIDWNFDVAQNNQTLRFLLLGDWGKGGTTGLYGSSTNDDDVSDAIFQMSMNDSNSQTLSSSNTSNLVLQGGGNKGGGGNNGGGNKNQKVLYQVAVAKAMGNFASSGSVQPSFLVALGDNFYSNGVSSATDALWNYLWKDVYLADYPSLNIPWYPVFGNHDYGGGASAVQAQIDRYHAHADDDIWMFESSNYTRRFDIPGDQGASVMIVFIDTTTLAPSLNKCCNENG